MLIHRDYCSNICLLICTLNLWIIISCLVRYLMFFSSLLWIIILYQIFSLVCRDCAVITKAASQWQIMSWAPSIDTHWKKCCYSLTVCFVLQQSNIFSCSLHQPKMTLDDCLCEFTMKHPKAGLKGNLPACTGATNWWTKVSFEEYSWIVTAVVVFPWFCCCYTMSY